LATSGYFFMATDIVAARGRTKFYYPPAGEWSRCLPKLPPAADEGRVDRKRMAANPGAVRGLAPGDRWARLFIFAESDRLNELLDALRPGP
jgi:hypothetical protein